MIAVPGDTPVKMPGASMVAIAVLLLLHTPPVTASLSGVESFMHTWSVPPIADGVGLTVSIVVAAQPVALVMYEIIAVPAAPPVTVPVAPTIAILVALLLHVPPVVASANVMVDPIHKAVAPVMINSDGLTAMILVTVQPEPNE